MFTLPTCFFGTFLWMLWFVSVLQLWHDKYLSVCLKILIYVSVSEMAHVHFQFEFMCHFPPNDFFLPDVYSIHCKQQFNSIT